MIEILNHSTPLFKTPGVARVAGPCPRLSVRRFGWQLTLHASDEGAKQIHSVKTAFYSDTLTPPPRLRGA
jgi:hypothetical protein